MLKLSGAFWITSRHNKRLHFSFWDPACGIKPNLWSKAKLATHIHYRRELIKCPHVTSWAIYYISCWCFIPQIEFLWWMKLLCSIHLNHLQSMNLLCMSRLNKYSLPMSDDQSALLGSLLFGRSLSSNLVPFIYDFDTFLDGVLELKARRFGSWRWLVSSKSAILIPSLSKQ